MSVEVYCSDGAMVLTFTSDPSSVSPPFCQLFCYCPGARHQVCQRRGPQAALGALWILTGLLHIGLGSILLTSGAIPLFMLQDPYCPLWLGVSFMFFGVCCILTERFPRRGLVLLSGLLSLSGAALSINGIVSYSIGFAQTNSYFYGPRPFFGHSDRPADTVSPVKSAILTGEEGMKLLGALSTSIIAALVFLFLLDLCLGLSSATLSFKALVPRRNKSEKKPLLEEEAKAAAEE